jgi:hypothetical protein
LINQIHRTKLFKQAVILLSLLVVLEWLQRHRKCPLEFSPNSPTSLRWAVYTFVFWITLYFVPPEGSQQFIYFEF